MSSARPAWRPFNPNPRGLLVGDCTVRSICAVTGLDWHTVHDTLCSLSGTMIITISPAAAEEFWSIGRSIIVTVPAICRCSTVSLRNISTQPVDLVNANIQIRPQLLR